MAYTPTVVQVRRAQGGSDAVTDHRMITEPLMFAIQSGINSIKCAWLAVFEVKHGPEGVTAAILALLLGFGTVANLVMMLVLLTFMTMDFITALIAVKHHPERTFSDDSFFGGLLGKMARLCVVAVAGGLDLVFSVNFPNTGEAMKMYTPVTKATLCWLIAAEGISIVRHVRTSEGEEVIPSIIIRGLDRLKLGGREPPVRRMYDREAITGEDIIRQEIKKENERKEGQDAGNS